MSIFRGTNPRVSLFVCNLILLAATFSLLLSAHSRVAAAEKPNVLFLFADDQRDDTIAAYGNQFIETPNLDRLAKSGFNFQRTYCMGSVHGAVCQPSRAMLNSGRSLYEYHDKSPLFVDKVEFAEIDLTGRERKPDEHQPKWIVEKYIKR